MRVTVLGSLAIALIATAARATTVEDLCGSPVPDPCRITTPHTLDPGSVIDARPGALAVATTNGRLDAGAGAVLILARDVTLEAGAKLLAAGGRFTVLASGRVTIDAAAKIDVSAPGGGGSILLGAGGDILVDGLLRAAGAGIPAFGGSVVVGATGAVRLHDVDVSGGSQASPSGLDRAAVEVVAGADVDLGGVVDVSHGECLTCEIQVTAGGTLTAASWSPGHGNPQATAAASCLGGSIVLDGDLVASGGGDPDFGGGGGDVRWRDDALDVNGSILLGGTAPTATAARLISRRWHAPDRLCRGLRCRGRAGCGGTPAFLAAGRDLTTGRLKLGGGSCGGGSLDVSAGRDLTVASRITAGATTDGTGGDVSLEAARTLHIDADVDTGGPIAGGGGSVLLEGCEVRVAAGIAVQSTGPGGTNTLLAHGLLAIAGRVEAGDTNSLAFGNPAVPPVITGPVVPPTAPVLDPSLIACTAQGGCGDGTRDATEECDDGNADSCDGCSASCQVELCGNGRLDCDEQCDPPDLVRCSATCQVIAQPTIRFPGGPAQHGCQAEWELELADAVFKANGLPQPTQGCTDGDPRCDVDGANDGQCAFRARMPARGRPAHSCVRAGGHGPRQAAWPLPLDPGDGTDATNASTLRCARESASPSRKEPRSSIRGS